MLAAVFVAFALDASTAPPSPAPSPSATARPSVPPDPCGSILSEVTRPTVATSACTLRPHHAIIEDGWSNTVTTGPNGGATTSFAQTFIHFGSWDPHLEFTLTPPSWNHSVSGGAVADGASDMAFGAKRELGYDGNAVWGIGAQMSVPSGDNGFTGGLPQYAEDANWSISMGPEYSIGGTVAFETIAGLEPHGAEVRQGAFVPSFVLAAATNPTGQLYLEYASFSHAAVGLPSRILYDTGYVRDLTPDTQVDLEYGFSPTIVQGQRQHYVGIGMSFMV